LIVTDEKLEAIREKLKLSGRLNNKTSEQIVKERYDGVLEEVNFDYQKFHDWLYQAENKDKIEIIKLEGSDYQEAVETIFNSVKTSPNK